MSTFSQNPSLLCHICAKDSNFEIQFPFSVIKLMRTAGALFAALIYFRSRFSPFIVSPPGRLLTVEGWGALGGVIIWGGHQNLRNLASDLWQTLSHKQVCVWWHVLLCLLL